jgi:hypothetical protein
MIDLSKIGFDFLVKGSLLWLIILFLMQMVIPVMSVYLGIIRIKTSEREKKFTQIFSFITRLVIIFTTIYTLTYAFVFFNVDIHAFDSTESLNFPQWIGVSSYRFLYYVIPVIQVYTYQRFILRKEHIVKFYDSIFFVFTCLIVYRFLHVFLGLHYLIGTSQSTMKNIDLINTTLIVIVLYATSGYKKRGI